MRTPKVFFDADVLFAGSVSTTGAAHVLLRLSEISLVDGATSQQAVTEAERNLSEKLPQHASTFRQLADCALEVLPDPSADDLQPFIPEADLKDVPILAAACNHGSDYLVTFNVRHYRPQEGRIEVLRPGDLLVRIREQLAGLGPTASTE